MNTPWFQFVWSKPFMFALIHGKWTFDFVYRWVLCIGWLEIRRWKHTREKGTL